MALKLIKRDLLHCESRAVFDGKYLSADATNQTYTVGYGGTVYQVSAFDGVGLLVPWTTPVFIADTHEIWLKGDIWACRSVDAWGVLTDDGRSVQEVIDVLESRINQNPYLLSFDTDVNDGCVYFEEEGIDIGGTFEIDANGCMIYDFTTNN